MYANKELCEKFNNNIPASELNGSEFFLLMIDYELQEFCESFQLPADDITAALISTNDGDYEEVYLTESSRPYSLGAIYHPLAYYKED